MPDAPALPLSGVRVIDFTNAVAGPTCSFILGDMGADVIKVESPTARSPRAHGTPLPSPDLPDHPWNRLTNFNELNRSKRGIVLDAGAPGGRDAFLRLASVCDVVVENFAPRVVGNLGIDYESVKRVRPDIIYVSMPAFGKSGPYRDRISYGPGIDAMSGISHLTGYEDGPPMKPGNYFCDQNTGLLAAYAIMAALDHRARTGAGQYIECAMIEGELQLIGDALLDVQMNGRVQTRRGNRDTSMAPHNVYRCRDAGRGTRDAGEALTPQPPLPILGEGGLSTAVPEGSPLPMLGEGPGVRATAVRASQHSALSTQHSAMNTERWVAIAVGSDAQWQALCAVIGRPELADDPRFADVVSRYRHQQEADAIIAEWTRTRDYHEVMRRLQSAGVPAGGALTMAELHQDPHVRARGVFRPVTHPEQGSVPHTRVAYKLSRFPSAGPRLPAPRFGQDNAAVLGDLAGVSAEELGALADAGVVADRPRAVGG